MQIYELYQIAIEGEMYELFFFKDEWLIAKGFQTLL